MTSVEIRFFWLLLSKTNCNGEPFTHISEWKRCSPSSGCSGSIIWILVVAMVRLGSTSMICFHLLAPLLGSDSELERASDSKAFSLATSDCLAQHSLALWVELLRNSHHFLVSFFIFAVLLFSCSFGRLSWVALFFARSFFLWFGAPFPCFGFADPNSRFFYLNFYSILTAYRYTMPSKEMSMNSIILDELV